jgi:hypothetical protein
VPRARTARFRTGSGRPTETPPGPRHSGPGLRARLVEPGDQDRRQALVVGLDALVAQLR